LPQRVIASFRGTEQSRLPGQMGSEESFRRFDLYSPNLLELRVNMDVQACL
jgi:hypothetical protein